MTISLGSMVAIYLSGRRGAGFLGFGRVDEIECDGMSRVRFANGDSACYPVSMLFAIM
jgi:hypothetical protein